MPVIPKPSGPLTRRQRQSFSERTSAGTSSCWHTIDSSASVRVTETNGPVVAQAGGGSSAASRHTA